MRQDSGEVGGKEMMNPVKMSRTIFVVVMVVLLPIYAAAGDVLDFAVIQPGQPGSPEEAQPVMDALAAYIQNKTGSDAPIKGSYFNDVDPALVFLHNRRPSWGIVRLGFYSRQADTFGMVPVAATRPGGSDKDRWRLVVSKDGPEDWKGLKGKVMGNMLFEKDAAACLLFGVPADQLSFDLKGTFQPLRSVRDLIRGKAAGAVLDQTQYDAIQAMPLANEIKVIHASSELPASPVVWFGPPGATAQKLVAVLLRMKEDKDAQALLKLLQTDGFGPADSDLPRYKMGPKGAECFQ